MRSTWLFFALLLSTLLLAPAALAADGSQGSLAVGAVARGVGFLVGVGFAVMPDRLWSWTKRRQALTRVQPRRGETPAHPMVVRLPTEAIANLRCDCGQRLEAPSSGPDTTTTVRFDGQPILVVRRDCHACGQTTRRFLRTC